MISILYSAADTMSKHNKNVIAVILLVLSIFIALNFGAFFLGPTGLVGFNDSNSAPVWISETAQFSIGMNSELLLDLNDYFIDEDNDTLSFVSTQPSDFTVVVSDSILELSPDEDFVGTRSFSLSAFDGKDVVNQDIIVDVVAALEEIKDNNDKFYGKKLLDESEFETHFASIVQSDTELTVVFFHDSETSQQIWVEGDISYSLSKEVSAGFETVTLIVDLFEGIVPKFNLHVGSASEVFEFGKEIPAVFIEEGNYSLVDRADALLDVEINAADVSVVIKGTDSTSINAKAGAVIDDKIKTEVFAADSVSMEEAEITLPAAGDVNAILECTDFDVDAFTCNSGWTHVRIPFTRVGDNVVFTVNHFSGYAGGFIQVINVQSYPTKGGNWTVLFNTTGSANLTITAANGTSFITDVQFLELRCGNTSINVSYDGTRVFYANYSCNKTSYETSKVLTDGKHHLKFEFGNSTAYAHNLVVVGANNITTYANATLIAENPQDSAGAASAIADIDGDGVKDLIIGAPNFNDTVNNHVYTGKLYLIYNPVILNVARNLATANASWTGENTFSLTAGSLDVGDFNSDNVSDILVGASGDNSSGALRAGKVYVINGGPGIAGNMFLSNPASYSASFNGSNVGAFFGHAVHAGDVNNDGVDDVIIGEIFGNACGLNQAGRVYVFFGPVSGSYLAANANVTLNGSWAASWFGSSLTVGDFNGDSANDLIVGARGNATQRGAAFVFYGPLTAGRTYLANESNVTFTGETAFDWAGFSVVSGADANNDTIDDLLVGAPFFDFLPNIDTGKVYLMYGGAGWAGSYSLLFANASWYGTAQNDTLGHSMLLSDEDNNNISDVVMGAPGNDQGAVDAGSIYFDYAPFATPPGIGLDVSLTNGSLFGSAANQFLGKSMAAGSLLGCGDGELRQFEPGVTGICFWIGAGIGGGGVVPPPGGGSSQPWPDFKNNPCDPSMFSDIVISSHVNDEGKLFLDISGVLDAPFSFDVRAHGFTNGLVRSVSPGDGGGFSVSMPWDSTFNDDKVTVDFFQPPGMTICHTVEQELCGEGGKPEIEGYQFDVNQFRNNFGDAFTDDNNNLYYITSIRLGFSQPQEVTLKYCPSPIGEVVEITKPIEYAFAEPDKQVWSKQLCDYCAGYYFAAGSGSIGYGGAAEELFSVGEINNLGYGGQMFGGSNLDEPVSIGVVNFGRVSPDRPAQIEYQLPRSTSGEDSNDITGMAVAGQFKTEMIKNPQVKVDPSDFGTVIPKCLDRNGGKLGGGSSVGGTVPDAVGGGCYANSDNCRNNTGLCQTWTGPGESLEYCDPGQCKCVKITPTSYVVEVASVGLPPPSTPPPTPPPTPSEGPKPPPAPIPITVVSSCNQDDSGSEIATCTKKDAKGECPQYYTCADCKCVLQPGKIPLPTPSSGVCYHAESEKCSKYPERLKCPEGSYCDKFTCKCVQITPSPPSSEEEPVEEQSTVAASVAPQESSAAPSSVILGEMVCSTAEDCGLAGSACVSGLCVNAQVRNPNAMLMDSFAFFSILLDGVYPESWIVNAEFGDICAEKADVCYEQYTKYVESPEGDAGTADVGEDSVEFSADTGDIEMPGFEMTGMSVVSVEKPVSAGNEITGASVSGSCASADAPDSAGSSTQYACGSGVGSPPAGSSGSVGFLSMFNNILGTNQHCGNDWIICDPCPAPFNAKKTPKFDQPENPTPGGKKQGGFWIGYCGVDGDMHSLYFGPDGITSPTGFVVPPMEEFEPGLWSIMQNLVGGVSNRITGRAVDDGSLPQGDLVGAMQEIGENIYYNQEGADEFCVEIEGVCGPDGRCMPECPVPPEPYPPEPEPPYDPGPPIPPPPGGDIPYPDIPPPDWDWPPPGWPPPDGEIPGWPGELPTDEPPADLVDAVDTEDVPYMPGHCTVISWQRKEGGITAREVTRDVDVPEGYNLIAGPIAFDCLDDDLDMKFNVPDNYEDIRAFRCIMGECRAVDDVGVFSDELVCDGMPVSEYRRRELLGGASYLPPAEIEVIEHKELIVNYDRKSLTSEGYTFEFTGVVPEGTKLDLFSPDFDVPLAANPSITIISTPLVVEFDGSVPGGVDARIIMPYKPSEGIDENTISIYLLQEGQWIRLDSTVDKERQIVSAYVYDIKRFIKDNKIVFAVMAVKCKACIVSELKKVYDPGSRDVIVLIHGLTSSSETWQFLIDDYVFNKQPWQIWTFDYPSYMTVDEMAKDLADSLQMNNAEFDNVYVVGHSLGGFIGQRALEIANEDKAVYTFLRKVRKVILAGNPGKGSPTAEVYDVLFNELINVRSVAKVFDLNSEVIQDLVDGRQFLKIPGVKYYVIAGTLPYEFNLGFFTITTADIFELLGINDGIVTTDSASFVGGDFINDKCNDYFEIKLTHTDLIDGGIPRRIIARIISEDKADIDPEGAYLGYNKYVDLLVDHCNPEEYFIVVGRPISELETPAPMLCSCGNGVCGEDETPDTCPQDCIGLYSLASVCMTLPLGILLLLLLLVVLTFVYLIRKRVQKKQVGPVWKTGLWFLILLIAVLLIILWFICRVLPLLNWIILILVAIVLIVDALIPWEPKKEEKLEEIKKGAKKTVKK